MVEVPYPYFFKLSPANPWSPHFNCFIIWLSGLYIITYFPEAQPAFWYSNVATMIVMYGDVICLIFRSTIHLASSWAYEVEADVLFDIGKDYYRKLSHVPSQKAQIGSPPAATNASEVWGSKQGTVAVRLSSVRIHKKKYGFQKAVIDVSFGRKINWKIPFIYIFP